MILTLVATIPLFAFMPKESGERCYKVCIHVRQVEEVRTAYIGGSVISTRTMKDDVKMYESVCASSESEARNKARNNCSSTCSRDGNYVRKTTVNGEDAYVFEVRTITSIEIVGSCGEC